uniref:Bet v I/Major latex protein domain-containing protein n=1 Tax=Solanum lycopersicum TaxID=4081 RepID=A0A3Q7GMC8_SOLLC
MSLKGDVFHEFFRQRPHHLSNICPDKIQNVNIHEGEWGTVGSINFWNFTHGKHILYLILIFIMNMVH